MTVSSPRSSSRSATAPPEPEAESADAAAGDSSTTSTPAPPEPPDGPEPRRPQPPFLGGVLAAAVTASASVLVCTALSVLGWLLASSGAAVSAIRFGANGWLLAHRVPLDMPQSGPSGGTFALAPLGVTAVLVVILYRAGRWTGRNSAVVGRRDHVSALAGCVIGYAVCGVAVALLGRSGSIAADPVAAAVVPSAVAAVPFAVGLLAATGRLRRLSIRLPGAAKAVGYGVLVAAACLFGAATLIFAVALVAHVDRLGDMMGDLAPGVGGAVLLTLLCVAYLPNAVAFTASYLIGPGFALGAGTAVAPSGIALGPLPIFPLLAAVPAPGTPAGWLAVLFVLPIGAGLCGGLLAVRRWPVDGIDRAGLRGVLVGAAGAALVTAGIGFAGGAAGPGRLERFGASIIEVGLIAGLTLMIGGVLGALTPTALARIRTVLAQRSRKEGNTTS